MVAKKCHRLMVTALAVASLVACGGGGGGGGSEVSSVSFPVEAVFVGANTGGLSVSGGTVDGSDNWTINLTMAPAADQTFEGVAVKQSLTSVTIKKNGATVVSSGGQGFFSTNPYAPKGLILADGSYGVQSVPANVLPATANVGSSGSLGKVTIYQNSSKATTLFTQEGTWTLEADTATTAYLCTNTTAKNTSNQLISTTAGCYKINTAGTVVGLRWTLAVAGKTLTFR